MLINACPAVKENTTILQHMNAIQVVLPGQLSMCFPALIIALFMKKGSAVNVMQVNKKHFFFFIKIKRVLFGDRNIGLSLHESSGMRGTWMESLQ